MRNEELHTLLESLIAHPIKTQWIAFKLGAGSITKEQIGEYISAMSNGACISNQAFGYLVWGVHDEKHEVKGTNFLYKNFKDGIECLRWRFEIPSSAYCQVLSESYKFNQYVILPTMALFFDEKPVGK